MSYGLIEDQMVGRRVFVVCKVTDALELQVLVGRLLSRIALYIAIGEYFFRVRVDEFTEVSLVLRRVFYGEETVVLAHFSR